jgi:hypothetical protein
MEHAPRGHGCGGHQPYAKENPCCDTHDNDLRRRNPAQLEDAGSLLGDVRRVKTSIASTVNCAVRYRSYKSSLRSGKG